MWSPCYLMPGKILNRVDNQNFSKLKLLIWDFRDNCNISLMHVPTLIKKTIFGNSPFSLGYVKKEDPGDLEISLLCLS